MSICNNETSKIYPDTSIIIKDSDKGSDVVVWDREYYLREVENME